MFETTLSDVKGISREPITRHAALCFRYQTNSVAREFFFPLRAHCDNRIASGLCRQSLQPTPNVVL